MPENENEIMTTEILQHFPLNNAYLCQDCDTIGNNAVRCPACASDALMVLEVVLNRKREKRTRNRTHAEFPSWQPQIGIAA